MTIGILASGPQAGLAVFRALRAVEQVGQGAIGGFASFVALDGERLLRHETQRGGTSTLFTAGERTGGEPDAATAAARLAGVMSSGPDRPVPLSQFTPAATGIGIVTGHRLPNAGGRNGVPLNTAVLDLMGSGCSPKDAVDQVLESNPEADAGLIAGNLGGRLYSRNSSRVAERPDLGHAGRVVGDVAVEVLHNAIHPVMPLADLAAEIALDVMLRRFEPDGEVTLRAGTPVVLGEKNRVLVDEDLVVLEVQSNDPRIIAGSWNCAAVYLGSCVVKSGAEIGVTLSEPNIILEDGRLVTMSGQTEMRIGYRKSGR